MPVLLLIRCFCYTPHASASEVGCHGCDSVLGCYRLLANAMHAQGAAANDMPRLASSRYRLTRQLSPDMTSSIHLCFYTHRAV